MTLEYTCPMHPEIVSSVGGKCPKCGMALVRRDVVIKNAPMDRGLGMITWRNYLPLIVVFCFLIVVTLLLSWLNHRWGSFDGLGAIQYFMSSFFIVFATFKLLDLRGFADGYATYDLIAGRVKAYGFVYPFIELFFGLAMLAGFHTDSLLWSEIGVMVMSGAGVAYKLLRREPFMCACLGTFLKVPLTYVTLIEDFGMALLAATLLLYS